MGFGGVVVALTRRKEGATGEAGYQAQQTVRTCRQMVIRRVAPGKVDGGMSSVVGVAVCDGAGGYEHGKQKRRTNTAVQGQVAVVV